MENRLGSLECFMKSWATPNKSVKTLERRDRILEIYKRIMKNSKVPIKDSGLNAGKIQAQVSRRRIKSMVENVQPEKIKRRMVSLHDNILKNESENPLGDNSKLTPTESIRCELMMDRRHVIMKSMMNNLREKEKIEAIVRIDQYGFDSMLSSNRALSLNKFKENSKKLIIISPKEAESKVLLQTRRHWMHKHRLLRFNL